VRRLAPLIIAVVLVGLGGCGSSSGDSNSASDAAGSEEGSLTKAEFVVKADALCEASKAKQEPLRKKLEAVTRKARGEEQSDEGLTDGTRRELAETLGRIVAVGESNLSRIQAVGPPKADARQLEAIFQKTESAFGASLAYGAALEHHEDAKAQAIAEKANAETRETAVLAKRYGLKVCGTQP
jgi:hypothetical protein